MTTKNLPTIDESGVLDVQIARDLLTVLKVGRSDFVGGVSITQAIRRLDTLLDGWTDTLAQAAADAVRAKFTRAPRDEMNYVDVISEMIARAGYNDATGELRIVFHDKQGVETAEFSYLDVPRWIFDELVDESNSAGNTYNEYLRGNYEGRACYEIGGERMTAEDADKRSQSMKGSRGRRTLRWGRS